MTDMIEKVARAICERDGSSWDASGFAETDNGCEPEEQREYWRDKARAAIEAMREPSEAMLEAGKIPTRDIPLGNGTTTQGLGFGASAESLFTAMIDAALTAHKEGE